MSPCPRTWRATSRRLLPVALIATLALAPTPSPPGASASRTVEESAPARLAAELVDLLAIQAVAGHEDALRTQIRRSLPEADLHEDTIGNLSLEDPETVRVLIAAPLDEPGLLVSAIGDDGYLRTHRVTDRGAHPLYEQYRYGQPVQIRTAEGEILPAVSATTSTHIAPRDDPDFQRIRRLDDLWIDVGARDGDEVRSAGIDLLDSISLRRRGHALAGTRVAGEHAARRGPPWRCSSSPAVSAAGLPRRRPWPGSPSPPPAGAVSSRCCDGSGRRP